MFYMVLRIIKLKPININKENLKRFIKERRFFMLQEKINNLQEKLNRKERFVYRHNGKFVLASFVLMMMFIVGIVKLGFVPVSATGVSKTEIAHIDGLNDARMKSIQYVFDFDKSISKETKEKVYNYMYSTVSDEDLLHMVNMREHVVFGNNYTLGIKDDDPYTLYSPIDVSIDDIENAMANLP